MPTAITIRSQVRAVLTDSLRILEALRQAEEEATTHGLHIAAMPEVATTVGKLENVKALTRPLFVDTVTAEYYGIRGSSYFYEIAHGCGPLAAVDGLEQAVARKNNRRYFTLAHKDWEQLGKGIYKENNFPRIHLDDIKRDDVPALGTPYLIFVRPAEDKYAAFPFNAYDKKAFMEDDGVLMRVGSREARELLGDALFKDEVYNPLGLVCVDNLSDIASMNGDATPKGRLLSLGSHDEGIRSIETATGTSRFLVVDPEYIAKKRYTRRRQDTPSLPHHENGYRNDSLSF